MLFIYNLIIFSGISILICASGLSNIVMAADFTINSAQTTENGGNTLDGSDMITVTTAGSISITSGSGIETSGDYNTVLVNGSISTTGIMMETTTKSISLVKSKSPAPVQTHFSLRLPITTQLLCKKVP